MVGGASERTLDRGATALEGVLVTVYCCDKMHDEGILRTETVCHGS